jgi:hypothetical protein
MDEWLQPTRLIDCGHPKVVAAAATATEGAGDDVQKALLLYFFVRDAIKFGIPAKFGGCPGPRGDRGACRRLLQP